MSGCHSKNSKCMCSSLKTVPGKIRDRYQTYCTVYKMHIMATHHGVAGHLIERDINFHIEDTGATNLDHDNESTSGSDTNVPWEDQRQKVTHMTLYKATRPH